MEKTELAKRGDELEKAMRENFEKDQNLTLCFFVFAKRNGESTTAVVPVMEAMFDRRHEMLYVLGRSLAQNPSVGEIEGVAMISETWVSTIPKEEAEKDLLSGKFLPPSKDPQRKEMAMVALLSGTGESELRGFWIEEKQGKKMLGEKFKADPGSQNNLLQNFFKGYYGLKR